MASRIQGITVEIGGDVGPLQKALKEVNSTISTTQSQLKDVEKLLKLDPKNVELLRQKQEGLSTAVEATKEKLNTLREVSESVTVSSEKYEEWKKKFAPIQGEITKTENTLAKLQKQSEECDKQIKAGIKAEAKYNALQSEIDETEKKYEDLKKECEEADKQLADGKISQEKYDELQAELKETEDKLGGLKDASQECERVMNEGKLAQEKYDSLQTEISETETKLDSLKQKAKDVTDEFGNPISPEQYNAIQREIIETEENLKSLARQAAESNQALTKIGNVGDTLQNVGGKISSIGQGLTTSLTLPLVAAGTAGVKSFAEVDKTMQLTNKTMGNSAEEAELLNQAMKEAAANSVFGMTDAATATLNFARAGLDAEQAAAALAPAMNLAAGEGGNLDTVSGGLVATINSFHGSFEEAGHYADVFAAACNNSALDVDSLSNAMSIAAPVFSAAGYSVNDAALFMGIMADNGIDANKAATSLKTSFKRLVSPPKQAAEMLDKLEWSITNADGSMKDSITIQRELHDKFQDLSEAEQIAAASAIFGANHYSPWLALINSSPEKVEALNIELEGASFSIDDFSKKLEASGGSLDEMKANMEKLGVSSEDFDAILKAAGGDADLFADDLWEACDSGVSFEDVVNALGGDLDGLGKVMSETVGITDEMAEAMMSGFGGSIDKLKSSIDVAVNSFGEALAPTIRKVADAIQSLVDKFNALTPAQQQTVAKISLIVAAIGPALVAFGKLTAGIGGGLKAFEKIGKKILAFRNEARLGVGAGGKLASALSSITPATAGVVAGVAAAVAAFVHLWRTNEGFRERMTEIWEGLKAKFDEFGQKIVEILNSVGFDFEDMGEVVNTVIEGIKTAWDGFCNLLAPVFEAAFEILSTTIGTVLDVIAGIFQTFAGLFSGDWNTFWEGISSIFDGIVNGMIGIIDSVLQAIKGIVDVFLSWFGTDWETFWSNASSFISGVWTNITGFFSSAWENIQSVWNQATGFFNGIWDSIIKNPVLTDIPGKISGFFEDAKKKVEDAWNTMAGWFEGVWKDIKDNKILKTVGDTISGFFKNAKEAITGPNGIWTNITGWFEDKWKAIIENETLKKLGSAIEGFFKDPWNAITGPNGIWTKAATWFDEKWKSIIESKKLKEILGAITSPFKNAYNAILGKDGILAKLRDDVFTVIDRVKKLFNFEWKFPKPKMPHFQVSWVPYGPISLPHVEVEWYKKAMDNAMLLSNPTIFGMMGNKLLGGGEAGNEVVAGADKLMAMIQSAVAQTMEHMRYASMMTNTVNPVMGSYAAGSYDDATGRTIIAMLSRYLPYLPEVANMKMVTDTGALVGQLAPKMDKELGVISQRARRQ